MLSYLSCLVWSQDVKKIAALIHTKAPQEEVERAVVNGLNRRFYDTDVPNDVVDVSRQQSALSWSYSSRVGAFMLAVPRARVNLVLTGQIPRGKSRAKKEA